MDLSFTSHKLIFGFCSFIASALLVFSIICSFLGIDFSFGSYGVSGTYVLDKSFGDGEIGVSFISFDVSLDNTCIVEFSDETDEGVFRNYYWHFVIDNKFKDPNNEAFFGNFVSMYIFRIELLNESGYATQYLFFFDKESTDLYTRPSDGVYEGYIQNRFVKL